ncbi:MAG: DUF2214 family protein [Ekhidna sp.]|nr:DUF2214 family protein [Ekhidna sp.]MBC6410391.1 DUF2214 family protein [Ekhidna sp.]MBC6425346.1 DUF2214 family protein [Ekhidna sp.]
MTGLALNTYVHILFIIVIFCCLIAELMLINDQVSFSTIKRLSKIDGLYGLAAIIVVTTGLLNWMKFGKGYDYYSNNSLFIIKFSLFIVVGLLSLYPTILFAKWKKRHKEKQPEVIRLSHSNKVRKVIMLELGIMAFIPLLAELMANGIDL